MDPLTHLIIAYCLVFWVQKFKKLPAKFLIPYLIGAVLPDVDIIFNGLAYLAPKLFWIEHRAMSHSFVGIIPYVLVAAAILNIPKVKQLIWSAEKYPDLNFWSWEGIGALYLGSLAHFLPDFVVPTGMMILFPFSFKWYGIKILSTNNIHSIAAAMAVIAFWPLKWNRRRRNATLIFFLIVFSFYSSTRLAVNVRATNLFEAKYGEGHYSSNELIFTHNINYNIYDATNPQNRTYIIATIDGMQQKFILEEFIPEVRIFANSTEFSLALTLLNLSRQNGHYYRLWQKNQIVCSEIQRTTNESWTIRWFAPIREAEKRITIGDFTYGSSLEVIFHFLNDGTITKIIRPTSV